MNGGRIAGESRHDLLQSSFMWDNFEMEKQTKINISRDFGSGDFVRFLSKFPLFFQPVCGGLPHILSGAQIEIWTQILNYVDLAFEFVEILEQTEAKVALDDTGKKRKLMVLKTSEGTFKYIHQPVNLVGKYIVGLLGDLQPGKVLSGKSPLFRRALSALDFIYNYWVVLNESQKFTRGQPLSKQFLLSEFLYPIVPLIRCSTVDHIKIFKWCTVHPLAAVRADHGAPNLIPKVPIVNDDIEGQVPASSVIPWYVFKNAIGRRLRAITQGKATRKSIKLCHDIQETKRGCPVVPPEFVENALDDHKKSLSTPFQSPTAGPAEQLLHGDENPRIGNNSRSSLRTEKEFLEEMPRVLDFLLPGLLGPGGTLKPQDWKTCFPASTKACLEKFANFGGAREYLREQIFTEFGFSELHTSLHSMYEVRSGRAKETRTAIIDARDQDIMTYLWAECLRHKKPCTSQVKEILEPLKVRVITKSEALHQYLSIPVQKALHGALRQRRPFALLGRPVGGDMINDLVTRSRDIQGSWVSGDYKGATDGLSQEISEIVARRSIQHLAPFLETQELDQLLKNLVGQNIRYCHGDQPEVVTQKNGQLMGSILSFPILCLVNYLTYFYSKSDLYFEYLKYVQSGRGPCTPREIDKELVLINGDDILFKSTDADYHIWTRNLRFFGFTPSLGKNLRSNRFLMINSTMYVQSSTSGSDFFEHLPFPNLGLLKGRSKVGREESNLIDTKPLWTIADDIQDGFGREFPQLYRSWNRRTLEIYSNKGQRNYYGPRELGFCGLYDPNAEFTEPQRAWATGIYRQLTTYGPQCRTPPGLRATDQLVQMIPDTWNDCENKQPKIGMYIPILCPNPPGFTDAVVKRERRLHPFDGSFGEEPKTVFFKGSDFPKEYIPVDGTIGSKRILSLTKGFKFVRRMLPIEEVLLTS